MSQDKMLARAAVIQGCRARLWDGLPPEPRVQQRMICLVLAEVKKLALRNTQRQEQAWYAMFLQREVLEVLGQQTLNSWTPAHTDKQKQEKRHEMLNMLEQGASTKAIRKMLGGHPL